MQLLDDPSQLPRWLPRPEASTVAGQVPLAAYPDVVRLPLLEQPGVNPTWPQPLEPGWASLRLCDVLDANAPFRQDLPDEQVAALVRALVPEQDSFWFLVADTGGDVEWLVVHRRLGVPFRCPRTSRALRRALRNLAIDAGSVSEDAETSRYFLAMGTGPQDALVALTQLSTVYVWTNRWLLRLHGWREEHSMLVGGPLGLQQRLAAVGLPSWGVGPTVPWPPGCQGDHGRHFGLEPSEQE